MIISPIMKFIVDKEKGYPAPTEKEKLTRTINKFKRILGNISGAYNISETKFGLADMLVGRNDPGDWKEAMRIYNDVLEIAPSTYLRGRAFIGKAELLIGSKKKEDMEEALGLCEKARKILKEDLSDFFGSKVIAVEAELLAKRAGAGDYNKAGKLYEKIIKAKNAHAYFRGRSMVGKAELCLFTPKPTGIPSAINLCSEASKLLADRPDDYFAQKAKLVEVELRIKRGKKDDIEKASALCRLTIKNPQAYKELLARAKLDLAEISRHPLAEKLHKEVLEMEGLDPYLIDKARLIEKALKAKK